MSAPKWDAHHEKIIRELAAELPTGAFAAALAEIDRLRAALSEAHTLASARQTACDELRRERDAARTDATKWKDAYSIEAQRRMVAEDDLKALSPQTDRRFELVKAVLKSGKLYDTRLADFSGTVAVRLADEALAALNAPKASEAPHVCARDPLDVIAREYVEFMAGRIDDGYARENANSSTDIGHLSILHRYHVARREAQERGK